MVTAVDDEEQEVLFTDDDIADIFEAILPAKQEQRQEQLQLLEIKARMEEQNGSIDRHGLMLAQILSLLQQQQLERR